MSGASLAHPADDRPESRGRVPNLRRADRFIVLSLPACNQDSAVYEKSGRMDSTRSVKPTSVSPGAGDRIKYFTRSLTTREAGTPRDQHATVEKGCNRAPPARIIHIGGGCPATGCRIISFGAGQGADRVRIAACHQHFPVLQQCCHMFFATEIQKAGPDPPSASGIVDFGACHTLQAIVTASHHHAPVQKERGSVAKTCIPQTASGRPCSRSGVIKLRRSEV